MNTKEKLLVGFFGTVVAAGLSVAMTIGIRNSLEMTPERQTELLEQHGFIGSKKETSTTPTSQPTHEPAQGPYPTQP